MASVGIGQCLTLKLSFCKIHQDRPLSSRGKVCRPVWAQCCSRRGTEFAWRPGDHSFRACCSRWVSTCTYLPSAGRLVRCDPKWPEWPACRRGHSLPECHTLPASCSWPRCSWFRRPRSEPSSRSTFVLPSRTDLCLRTAVIWSLWVDFLIQTRDPQWTLVCQLGSATLNRASS